MPITARDIMETHYVTLHPQTPIAEAVKLFQEPHGKKGGRIFGLLVTNDQGQLVGMLSMYDIFLLLRPKHIHIWGEMADLDLTGIITEACQKAKSIQVGDIMTTDLITITPDTHMLMIVDIMIKKHVRRIPVLEQGKILGIVYISKVFDHLLEHLGN